MSEVIDHPHEVASEVLDRAEINSGTMLVQYSKTEAELAILRTKYDGVQFDLTTTAGDKAARAGRLELVTLRTSLEKKRKEFKAPALEYCAKIDAEAKRITGEIVALESPINAQIVADENRRAAEKAEKERIEAERVAAHRGNLNMMRHCIAKSQSLPSDRIANGIAVVEGISVNAALWQEFAEEAATVKAETLAAMQTMLDTAKAREDEAVRIEAQRVENERIAALQAAEAKRLQDAADALAAQQKAAADKLAADQDALELQRAEFAAAQAKAQREATELVAAKELAVKVAEDEQSGQDEFDNWRQGGSVVAAIYPGAAELLYGQGGSPVPPPITMHESKPVAPTTPPTLKLGTIGERLGFTITADFLKSLGFEPAATEKASKLFHEADFSRICAALVGHIELVQARRFAA